MGSTPTTTPAAPPGQAQPQPGVAEQLEHQMVGARAVRFITERVQPPAALYVTADDGLYVNVSNVATGLQLTLTGTILLPDGRVQANTWNMNPPSNGAQTPYLFPLAEGFLLNVSVMPQTTLRYGQTWVFVCVRRGGMVSGVNLQTLISDTLDSYGGPTWPGSVMRHSMEGHGLLIQAIGPTPSAGNPYTTFVPSYARWLLHSIYGQYSAANSGSARQMFLGMWDASGMPLYREYAEATQAINTTNSYVWALKLGTSQTTFQNTYMARSLPEMYLLPGSQISMAALNSVATDTWVAVSMSYEQWFSF